jgi:hypothetical protein
MVTAFAIASLFPPDLSLSKLLSMASFNALVAFQDFVRDHIGLWLWTYICFPLLTRPAWFLPLGLAVVTGGVAVTLSTRPGTARSRRRS